MVATALPRLDILVTSQPGPVLAPEALHLHGASLTDGARPQTTRQGGLRTWGHTPASANLGNRGVGCSSTKVLSTAAEMSGAGRREGERNVPADALPAAPASVR